jgi:hypothetical protein
MDIGSSAVFTKHITNILRSLGGVNLSAKDYHSIIKQVASNKSSLLLKIQKQSTQTLRLVKKIIETESIYKSY